MIAHSACDNSICLLEQSDGFTSSLLLSICHFEQSQESWFLPVPTRTWIPSKPQDMKGRIGWQRQIPQSRSFEM
jgi:hypothetical protein